RTTTSPQTVLTEGFEAFEVKELGFVFQFPRDQAPLKATTQVTQARVRLASRDFVIEFYDGPGFSFHPWKGVNDRDGCLYDGALHNFQSQSGFDCWFMVSQTTGKTMLINSFNTADETKHVTVLPMH